MKAHVAIIVSLLIATACGGAPADKKHKRVGGCEIDTIPIGTFMFRDKAPMGRAARIEILSIQSAGEVLYRRIAEELTTALDSLGITIYSRSDLLHIKKGACWPPYRITFRIKLPKGEAQETIRPALLENRLAGFHSLSERPEGYGLFFITCGRGDRDLWTLWYPKEH